MDILGTQNKLGEAINSEDHTTDVVPLSERRGPITLGLLWITMVTGFPAVLAGFTWYQHGLTLTQVLGCALLSNLILMGYCIPACHLGAVSGQTYALMTRALFGRIGSTVVSLSVSLISLFWYGLAAVLLAEGLNGVFGLHMDTMWLSVILAFIMAVNNFFGFSGVANFAGFFAAPVLIAWIGLTFFKAVTETPAASFSAPEQVGFSHAITIVSALVIGNTAWGNEADYWRYSKPKLSFTVVPLVISVAIGQIVFPVTGWMLARKTGITDFDQASGLMTRYALGDAAILAAIVLVVTYWGLNDANLYAAINGIANLRKFSRKKLTFVLTVIGAIAAALLSKDPRSLETVCSLSSVMLPCASVVMLCEWFISWRKRTQPFFATVQPLSELPAMRWPAMISFVVGSCIGIATAGIIPNTESLHVGVSALQAWLTTFVVYVSLRPFEQKSTSAVEKLIQPEMIDPQET
ncbi:MAG: cytosine permease [Cyanobacteria bacterium]|nr:cytosine permease [Cyanobacteriota bacterium]